MIIAMLAAAAVQTMPAGCDKDRTLCWPRQALALVQGSLPNVPELRMSAEGVLLFAYPPCNTPEAAKADACVKWKLDRSNPRAIGYLPPLQLEAPGH